MQSVTLVLYSICFAVLINSGVMFAMARYHLSWDSILTSSDQAFYTATVAKGSSNLHKLGNVSLKEHANDPSLSTYAPLIQALFKRMTGLSTLTVMWVGNFFFPAVAFLLATFLFFPFIVQAWKRACLAFIILSPFTIGLLRPMNPQITLLFVLGYFVCFFRNRHLLIFTIGRSLCVALLLFCQPVFSVYFLILEGCAVAYDMWRTRKIGRLDVVQILVFAIPFAIALALKLALSAHTNDPVAISDTYRRLGLIHTHVPADPILQAKLLVILAAAFVLQRYVHRKNDLFVRQCMLAVCAGIIALNQSLLHGIDIIFGLYYSRVFEMVFFISAIAICIRLLRGYWQLAAVGFLFFLSVMSYGGNLLSQVKSYPQASDSFFPASEKSVVQWLQHQPGEMVILAPFHLSGLIPVFTSHFVVFNDYARYQQASDSELADRFLLQDAVFPADNARFDTTFGRVFGLAAGNLYAKHRNVCAVRAFFDTHFSFDECKGTIRQYIFHQDLLRKLDTPDVDVPASVRRFHVDLLLSPTALGALQPKNCRDTGLIAGYYTYDCRTQL